MLLALAALSFWTASAIHVGVSIPLGVTTVHDPFAGAAVPEAVLGVVCAVGATSLLAVVPPRVGVAIAAATFSMVVTLFGLSVTLGSGRTADVVYHLGVLAVLSGALLMLVPWRSRTERAKPVHG
jgi:hypothetical protein